MRFDLSADGTDAVVTQVPTESLGDHSYVVVVGGEAFAIDIQRDLDRFESVLSQIEVPLVAVFETHIHNDYVSGGKLLAERTGAAYIIPFGSPATYDHRAIVDGEAIGVGGWSVRALHTPGHTYNHTSYVLEAHGRPVAIFSGGSMLVGAVGRSDLLGPDHTNELLHLQYGSMHAIADRVPDPALVAPTHGSGSFCSASAVADTTSTVSLERQRNPALLAPNADVFAAGQLAGYRPYPAYYRYMAPMNLESPETPPSGPLPLIDGQADAADATLVDVRPFVDYADGHIAGSISVPASTDAAVYLGWTLPWNERLVIIGDEPSTATVRRDLQRIGWDDVGGRIDPTTLASFGPLATTDWITWDALPDDDAVMVDVRDPTEHEAGVIPGASAVHLPTFAGDPRSYASDGAFIHCQSGYRASIAAGFAERAGLEVTIVVDDMSRCPRVLVPG